jgi:hypothetical protein
MQTNYETTIHLSADDVNDIIKHYLQNVKGIKASTIKFDISTQICGIGPGEYECTNFKGATVRCDKESVDQQRDTVRFPSSLASQIASVESGSCNRPYGDR